MENIVKQILDKENIEYSKITQSESGFTNCVYFADDKYVIKILKQGNKSEKIDKETVMVKVKVTTIDMKPVMAEFMKDLLAYSFANAFADPQPTEEETNKATMDMLLECLSAEDLEFVTNEIDIKVVKVDKDWKIDANEDMADVLVGGMISAIEELAESFQEIE